VFAAPFWERWTEKSEVSVPEVQRTQLVSILVEEDLLEDNELSTKIARYGVDVQQAIVGQVILVPVPSDASPLDLWNGNAQLYFSGYNNDHKSQLIGTILIGDVPLPVVNKEGVFHATPFPFTDFENPSYLWNTTEERFVWQSGGDEQPEIWHGIIRSDEETKAAQIRDMKAYFDGNHRIHSGEETVSKKIFLADIPSQRRGISDQQKEMYQKWIDHLEDFSYLRFNKNWLNGLFEEINPSDTIPTELLPEAMQDADTSADFSAMPDVQTKLVIDQMAQRYLEAAREKIVEILSPAGEVGRWEAGEMDTTIGLIAKKDEWAAQILREANDEVETIFHEKLTDPVLDIPATRILKTEHKYQPYEEILGVNTPFGPPITKELYRSGVKLSEIDLWGWDAESQEMKLFDTPREFPAENCSILRGTAPDEEHPAGQLAELNRVYNFETAALDTCVDWDGDDTDDGDREDHEYEGCCAQNISFGGSGFDLSAPDCTVNGGWSPVFTCERVGSWQCGLSVLNYPLPLLINWEYIGATKPVFDLKGSRSVSSGIIGAQGCEDFFEEEGDSENQKEISTLMFHDEPRLETLQAQAAAQSVSAMPADDPRGASFYDSAEVFHRINFPSAFDFIGKDGALLLEEEKESFFSSQLEQSLSTAIASIDSTAGNSGKIVETDFDTTLWKNENRQQEVVDALLWLGKDLEQKHAAMIRGVLSAPMDAARILGTESFDGYEVLEIIGESAEDSAIRLEFEKGDSDMEASNTFRDAERESQAFSPLLEENWIEEGRTEEMLPEGWSAKEETGCSGINLLTWPTKCLIPWVTALPDSFSKTLSLPFDVPFSKEEQELLLEGNIPVVQESASVEVFPEKIIIAANDVMPITISVEIKDAAGDFVKSPQEVSLNATSADALDFFTISPSGTRIATGGKTQFRFIPKTRAFGGKFSFQISVGSITTEIPVSILQTELAVSSDASSVIAGETSDVSIQIHTLDLENVLTTAYDGKWITLSSELGTFVEGGRVKLKGGTAKVSFVPGTKAGEGNIVIQDEEKTLPQEEIFFEILPAEPDSVRLDAPPLLVQNGSPVKAKAVVIDRFGNDVQENVPVVEWNVSEKEGTTEGNTAFLETTSTDTIDISVSLPGKQVNPIEQSISVLSRPQLLVDVKEDSLQAGTIDPVFIPVSVEGGLPGVFDINVSVIGEAGIFPETIELRDGVGQLQFSAGTKAGRSTLQLQAPGFGSTTFILDVLPSDPYKIKMSAERTVLQIGDDRSATLQVRVVDKFDNEVPFVSDEISLLQNPGEKWEASDLEELESLGVIDENSSVKSYFEEQLVSTDIETNPVVTFDPTSLKITQGEEEVEIHTTEDKSGHIFLVATAVGLIPDTLELDVVRVLKQEEFDDTLSPKSLMTLFLGNAGGRLDKPSFGNRFLFDGKTQAVVTLIEEPTPDKMLFTFDPRGDFSPHNIIAEFENKFSFRVDTFARATISFSQKAEWNGDEGWNFLPEEGISTSIKKGSIWTDSQKIITLLPEGGFYLESDTEILPTNSWKEWDLYFQGEKKGTVSLELDSDEIFVDTENTAGVFFESVAPEIYIKSLFTGKSTTEVMGKVGFQREEKEEPEKTLQSSRISAEDALQEAGVGWTTDWKPGALFAAGNSVGESVRISASDATILLGDPTITRGEETQKNDAGFTNDIGRVIWSSPFGPIEQVLAADVNGDGRAEIFSRIGNKLFSLYHDRHQLDNFRDTGLFLRFADGVQKLAVHTDTQGSLLHFLQLNDEGKIILHTNQNQGTFVRQDLNLGIAEKIINFDIVELNGDMYSDLVLLDEKNTLWFAYGKKDQWYAAQYIDSFAPSFEKIDEQYIAAEEQSYPKTEVTKFPQLDDFALRFTTINENSTWSGETKMISNRSFVSLTDSRDFDTRYRVDIDDNNAEDGYSVIPGKRFSHSLVLSGNQISVSEGELIIPQSVGFRFEESSFVCNGCENLPVVKETSRIIHVSLGNIPAHSNIILRWETIAEDIPPIRYMTNDFEGNDGRDDVAIAWQSDSTAQTIQFLSTGNGIVPAKSSGTPASPFLKTHRRVIQEVFPDLLPSDFDAESTAEDVLDCLSTQQNEEGIPTILTTTSVEEAQENVIQGKKKTSWIDAIPSIVFLAPGPQSIYIPPFSIPIPIPAFGMPVLWVGPSPPFVGAGINPTSLFRLYVMPTTSLQVGLGICGGPVIDPTMTPTGVPFPPQCVVIVPQFSSGTSNSTSGSGGGNSGSSTENVSCTELNPANEATAQQELFQQLYAPVGDGRTRLDFSFGAPFTLKPMRASTNRQIKAADILSQWVQDQWRELTNFKFPKFNLKLPRFKTSSPAEGESVLSQLKKSPFVDIQTKKITINYPSFSDEALERAGKDMKQWKKDSQKKREETINEWNKVGCASLENGTWNNATESCDSSPESSAALEITTQFAQYKSEATILRLQAMNVALALTIEKKKKEALQAEIQTEKERIEKKNDVTLSELQSEITSQEEKIKNHAASLEIENQESVLEEARDKLAELKAIITEIETLRPKISDQKIEEARAFLSQKLEATLKELQTYIENVSADITGLEKIAEEIDTLSVSGREGIIEFLLQKIETLENVSAAEKISIQEEAAAAKAEMKTSVADKKEAILLSAAEKKTERTAAVTGKMEEKKAAIKNTQETLRSGAKDMFQSMALDPLEQKWEEFGVSVDKNFESLRSYVTEIKKLKTVPEKLKKLLEQVKAMADVINEYWSEWIEKNERAVKKWEEFGADTKKTIQTWKEIPEILKKFAKATSSSNGGSMTRGTLLAWLKNFILSAIKFPIIPMPQVPDVEIDLSEVKIGVKLEIPELEFNAVEVSPDMTPPIPNLGVTEKFNGIFAGLLESSWTTLTLDGALGEMVADVSLQIQTGELSPEALQSLLQGIPSIPEAPDLFSSFAPIQDLITSFVNLIPVLPVLPEAPSLPDMAFEMPPLVLPQLPSLIEPPKFPDFLKIPNLIMLVPKYLLAFLGLISRGIMPVPEWMVAMTVVNATNRTLLLPIDFLPGAKLPQTPKLVLPPLSYKLKWDFAQGIPSLVAALENAAAMFNSVTTQLSNASKGLSVEKVVPPVASPIPVAQIENPSSVASLLPETDFLEEQETLDLEPLKTFVLNTTQNDSPTHSWVASTSSKILSLDDYPQGVSSTYDMSSVPNAGDEIVVEPRILWFDGENNTTEAVTTFPLQNRRFATQRVDLDRDGEDEMIYSIGEQLFLKRRVEPRMTEEEEDAEFEIPQTLLEWSFDHFVGGFSPSRTFTSSVEADGSSFQFLPDQANDARYFEWIISERPDRIFESSTPAIERMSNVWRRVGFLVRPPATKYEIRPVGAQIKSVEGNPIMYGTELKTVEKFDNEQCSNGERALPFFAEETLFVGVADKSRLLIKTLARKGQVAEMREIELRKGEETVVDFAEVCLSRGEVQYLEIGKTEKLIPKEDNYFFSGMRLELGEKDQVELDLFDNTEITVWGGEQYELHQFSSREEMISVFKQLSRENYYGQLLAFQGKNKSWTRSKYFLHDPQTGDDTIPPQLEVIRGTNRSVLLGQKIEIDASHSYENQEFARVWWESKGKTIIDSDSEEYAPLELLTILLPAEYRTGVFPVVLHAVDISGNESELFITIHVEAPELELREASARDAQVSGKVVSGDEGVEIWFIREREGRQEILSRTTESKSDGTFVLQNLSRTGGAILRDQYTKEPRAEVLETGRAVLSNENLTQVISAAKEETPLHISLREKTGESAATITYVASKQEKVSLPTTEGLLQNVSAKEIKISNPQKERALWQTGEDGILELVDTTTRKIIGTVDRQGQFRTKDPEVYLKIQSAIDEKSPLIFEVWREKYVLAQFSMPSPEKITIDEPELSSRFSKETKERISVQ
jgi:hypothetical protein